MIPPVLTVPMRNGNEYLTIVKEPAIFRSYRTYEEWKQVTYDDGVTVIYEFLPYL